MFRYDSSWTDSQKLAGNPRMLTALKQMAKPHARGYFGVEAKAYGYSTHVDLDKLKVPSAHHIFHCARELNAFNDGWNTTAPSDC
ncbi:hypothetical protein GUITHDRAFT_121252 [Guillardia theta CCMP2712]|uniref:Uncharacterized protein n=1 Tax=Guillardia theta (strain CCMP2712) TaxID=905079 RepID=L1I9J8_GUITC|nr:hypothetical protein GUITHDRAFT_121252 [Guillardia theta CCMP2712]EKX32584.1 hypothetical protein GUITHDRAFT_121252 [Guillardia theta CCMP2712]|mmetsp:Transcript_46351/g.145398  ORF Transcript_46351/g.145398 Transcript_46351/m.145398 type:complete len:85 (+) Transcript_46351:572-826(+)|eukprot:XP_005819564.1 hypothetical protein GUITHDRAFT_121252 [Guillardia theta CCMP2712]